MTSAKADLENCTVIFERYALVTDQQSIQFNIDNNLKSIRVLF